jgi:tetratricopeptide (TPR) repeat protein
MPKVFISYRRDDSAYAAHAIYGKLENLFGPTSIVFDVDTIPLEINFAEYIEEQVSSCDVMLAIIGDKWLDSREGDGSRRIDNPNDFVRIEIQSAIQRNIPLVPVLVGQASIPPEDKLPEPIKSLRWRNAAELRTGRDFQNHLEMLVKGLDATFTDTGLPVSPEEQYKLGARYENGEGVKQNATEAVKCYRKASDQGHVQAHYALGYCYFRGQGVAQSYSEAVKYFRKAVDKGNSEAQVMLGFCYQKERGIERNTTEAVKLYRKAAIQGNAVGAFWLGMCYLNAEGVEQNPEEMVKWFRRSAEKNIALAQGMIGDCYERGISS